MGAEEKGDLKRGLLFIFRSRQYAESFKIQHGNPILHRQGWPSPYGRNNMVQNPPQKPLTMEEMDGGS